MGMNDNPASRPLSLSGAFIVVGGPFPPIEESVRETLRDFAKAQFRSFLARLSRKLKRGERLGAAAIWSPRHKRHLVNLRRQLTYSCQLQDSNRCPRDL
jgi:hypothetical protein